MTGARLGGCASAGKKARTELLRNGAGGDGPLPPSLPSSPPLPPGASEPPPQERLGRGPAGRGGPAAVGPKRPCRAR